METAPPCKQVTQTNQPRTYTQTHTNNSQSMHSCIHSIQHIHSNTLSQERSKHHHFHSSQSSSINHALHGPLSMAFVEARMTLPWLAHNGMHLHAYRFPTTLQRYIHPCIEMATSSHPLNVLMSIFGGGGDRGGGGGGIDRRVDAAASLMWRVDSWMADLKAMMVMRICVMIGSRMTYPLQMYTQRQRRTRTTTV